MNNLDTQKYSFEFKVSAYIYNVASQICLCKRFRRHSKKSSLVGFTSHKLTSILLYNIDNEKKNPDNKQLSFGRT